MNFKDNIEIIYVLKEQDFSINTYKKNNIICVIIPVGIKNNYYIDKSVPPIIKNSYDSAFPNLSGNEIILTSNPIDNIIYVLALCYKKNSIDNYIRLINCIINLLAIYEFDIFIDYKIIKNIVSTNFNNKSLDYLSKNGETETFEEYLQQQINKYEYENNITISNKLYILDYTDYEKLLNDEIDLLDSLVN